MNDTNDTNAMNAMNDTNAMNAMNDTNDTTPAPKQIGTFYDWAEPDTFEAYCLTCSNKPEVLKHYEDGHGSNTHPVQKLFNMVQVPGEDRCSECGNVFE